MKPSWLIGVFCTILAAGSAARAQAGAWPIPEGQILVIVPFTTTRANESFGNDRQSRRHSPYRKAELAPYLEYGLTRSVTLVSSLALTNDETDYYGVKFIQHSISRVELGARLGLGEWRDTRFAVQSLAIFHGSTTGDDPFSSRRGDVDEEFGLYMGRNFTFWGMQGFSDTYSAYRWRPGGRPSEVKLDVTIGVKPGERTMLLAKSENFLSVGSADRAEGMDRIAATKIGLSIVQEIERPVSLELGFTQTVAGQNIVRERALTLALWYRF